MTNKREKAELVPKYDSLFEEIYESKSIGIKYINTSNKINKY